MLSKLLVIAIGILGAAFIWVVFNILIRIRRLFSYPKNSIKSNRKTRKALRRIYFRPITCFARVANIDWQVTTISGRDPTYSNGVGFWAIDYINQYLFPCLGLGGARILKLLSYKGIKSADCLVDFGAIYPYRFYLEDGQIVDFVKERQVIKELTPRIRLGYTEKLANPSSICLCIFLALTMAYLPLLLYLENSFYSSYWYWLILLTLDTLIIFRPWLLLTGKKPIYSLQDFMEKANLVTSNFEMANRLRTDQPSKKIMTVKNTDRLFFKDTSGLISDESYIAFDKEWPLMAFMSAMGMTLITLISLVLIIKIPLLGIIQICLNILLWILALKG